MASSSSTPRDVGSGDADGDSKGYRRIPPPTCRMDGEGEGSTQDLENLNGNEEEVDEIIDDVSGVSDESTPSSENTNIDYSALPIGVPNPNMSNLAVYKSKMKFTASLQFRQVFIIEGFTGCGKTTQVPQFIIDDCAEKNIRCKIAVTQPRRIAAISVASRVSEERGWEFERSQDYSIVGYQVGMDKKCDDHTLLTYMTTGVLLQKIIKRKSLKEWTHILIDEVHERDLDTDLLCLIIKKLLIENNNTTTKIILMSATLNVDKFADYFPSSINPEYNDKFMPQEYLQNESPEDLSRIRNGAIIVRIQRCMQHKITEEYTREAFAANKTLDEEMNQGQTDNPAIPEETYIEAVRIIERLDKLEILKMKSELNQEQCDDDIFSAAGSGQYGLSENRGAVLVFLPGLFEIDTMIEHLKDSNLNIFDSNETRQMTGRDRESRNKWVTFPLHSSITSEEQRKVFRSVAEGHRKIICATNIAESSITVADIKYVIDFCLTKSLSCDPLSNFSCLKLEWASKNQCIQRKGRVGRVSDGICYRMVTERFYDTLQQESLPEMEIAALESVVLSLKMLDMGNPESLFKLAIDPPESSCIRRAVANLKEIGALTLLSKGSYESSDGDLTHVGEILAQLPIDIRLGRFIILGHVFGLLEESIIIACGLSARSPFSHPYGRRLEAYLSKLSWADSSFSDCFAIFNLYTEWDANCQENYFRGQSEYKWYKDAYAQVSVLREMKSTRWELIRRLRRFNIVPSNTPPVPLSPENERGIFLKMIIAGAFFPNYFLKNKPILADMEREIHRDLDGQDYQYTVNYLGFPSHENGKWHAQKIARQFRGGKSLPPFVDFFRSKVLLTFDNRSERVGLVSIGVYKTLKMRHLKHNVSFKTVRYDFKEKMSKRKDTSSTDTPEKVLVEGTIICPPQLGLPDIQEPSLEVYITHIESPEEFWVILKEVSGMLDKITSDLHQAEENGEMKELNVPWSKHPLVEGLLCVVKHIDDDGEDPCYTWARARIDCVESDKNRRVFNDYHEDEVLVFLIDNGEAIWVDKKDVYALPESLVRAEYHLIECMAYQCKLQDIKGSAMYNGNFSEFSIYFMTNFIDQANDALTLSIHAIVDGIIVGDLIHDGSDLSLVTSLLFTKAVEKQTIVPAKIDNMSKIRKRFETEPDSRYCLTSHDDANRGQKAMFFGPQKFEETASDYDCDQVVTLRGGFSPLELSFASSAVSRASYLKQVAIDAYSVNSIILEQEPFAACSKLLVSQNVGIIQKTGGVILRNTTLMPSIPGLIGLVTMLYAPKVEFRVDSTGTHYTGLIAGLGQDPYENQSLYPDHDIEISFEALIENQDVELINSIRTSMNRILRREQPENLPDLQRKMQSDIIKLLERKRKGLEETWQNDKFLWGQMGQAKIMVPKDEEVVYSRLDPFPLHSVVKFEKVVEKLKDQDKAQAVEDKAVDVEEEECIDVEEEEGIDVEEEECIVVEEDEAKYT